MGISRRISPFESVTGAVIDYMRDSDRTETLDFHGEILHVPSTCEYALRCCDGEAVAVNQAGEPAMVTARYGKGTVVTLNVPLETAAAGHAGMLSSEEADRYDAVYTYLMDLAGIRPAVAKTDRYMLKTEYPESDGVRICCINPTETVRIDTLTPAVPATLEVISGDVRWEGESIAVRLEPGAGCFFRLKYS